MDTCFLIMNPEIHTGIMIAYSANIAGLTGCLQIEEWEQIYAYHHAQNLSQSASRSQHNSRYTESVRIEARGIIMNSSDFWTEQKYHRYWDQQLIIGTSWNLMKAGAKPTFYFPQLFRVWYPYILKWIFNIPSLLCKTFLRMRLWYTEQN